MRIGYCQLPTANCFWAVLLLAGWLGGCSTSVVPPDRPEKPVTVFVADYGRHTSLLLPQAHGGYREYAYGDWDFFALSRNRWYDGLHALFVSSGGTLGRRYLSIRPDQPDVRAVVGSERLLRFEVPQDKALALGERLNAAFVREQDGGIVYNRLSDMLFVHDREHYSLFNNCNHITARWLRELDCGIHGSAMTSRFRLAQ